MEIIGQLKIWPGAETDGDSIGVRDLPVGRTPNDDELAYW